MGNFMDNLGAAFVNAFDEEYRNAEIGPRTVNLPEGKYQFVVNDVSIINRDNFKYEGLREDQYYEYTLVIRLQVVSDGPYKDAYTSKFNGICLANIKRIKSDLSAMGHEFSGLENLVKEIEDGSMIGLILEGRVTIKHKGDKAYTNVWLDRCVGRMDMAKSGGFSSVVDDDELPWGD